ncbi:hypothetical protein CDAR_433751 [Caerostris darwini]|uniref:Uncharacterized protein n=1 Tax=Caerostris darwini TaxID=1538125 RepID=A0AAV4VVY1_9ARAC|nr:hypothetical protein CDAR_433751 [Caerostris darwini]
MKLPFRSVFQISPDLSTNTSSFLSLLRQGFPPLLGNIPHFRHPPNSSTNCLMKSWNGLPYLRRGRYSSTIANAPCHHSTHPYSLCCTREAGAVPSTSPLHML